MSHSNNSTEHCVSPVKWTYDTKALTAKGSIDLPIDSNLLFFATYGNRSNGSFELNQFGTAGAKVIVDITAHYYKQDRLDKAEVCKAARNAGENGLRIAVRAVQIFMVGMLNMYISFRKLPVQRKRMNSSSISSCASPRSLAARSTSKPSKQNY